MAIGLSDAGTQISDATNPNQEAAVDKYGNLKSQQIGLDQTGVQREVVLDSAGRPQFGSAEILLSILVELRTLNALVAAMAAGTPVSDDPDAYRQDADVTGFLTNPS